MAGRSKTSKNESTHNGRSQEQIMNKIDNATIIPDSCPPSPYNAVCSINCSLCRSSCGDTQESKRLVLGDCMDVLRRLPSESIDAIITDPPYGINYQSRMVEKERRKKKIAGDKKVYIWWLKDAFRALKDGGHLLCFSRWDVQQKFIDAAELAGFRVRSVLIWDRMQHGMGDPRTTFAPQYDTIIFATKGRYLFPGNRPANVYRVQKISGSKLAHPNEKPVDLMLRLINDTTRPNDLILDPFAGSGATLVAAAESGRRFIGVELDAEYYGIAKKRINDIEKGGNDGKQI